jgi:hypothetical protein
LAHPPNLDDIQRVYQITGEIDHLQQSREVYRAFVDRNGLVVYLENTYAYSAP